MLSRITAIVAVALATSPFLVQAQQCAFIFDQARLRSDISTTKLRLKLIQDEIDLDARRKTFEDALLRQHFPLTCNEFVLAFWKRTKAIGIDDSVAYEYWTVQLPYMREGTTYNFPSDQTSAYFSAGGSACLRRH